MNIYQKFYNLARQIKDSPRYDRHAIKRLQQRFCDYRIDIRRVTIDAKPFWALVRWEHPKKVIGKLANTDGLFDLPVVKIPERWKKPNGDPKNITIGDIDRLINMPYNAFDLALDSMQKEWQSNDREAKNLDETMKKEMNPYFSGNVRSYGTGWMVEENEKRIVEGAA